MKSVRLLFGVSASQASRKAGGFSLLEMFAVISIISLLLMLMFPSIQAFRERARMTACSNNLRQLNLGLQGYLSTHQKFPPGTLGISDCLLLSASTAADWQTPGTNFFWKRAQHTSWQVAVLPYVGEDDAYQLFPAAGNDFSQLYYEAFGGTPEYSWLGEYPDCVKAIETKVPILFCPSDGLSEGFAEEAMVLVGRQPVFDNSTRLDGFLSIADPYTGRPRYGCNYSGCSGAYSGGNIPDRDKAAFRGIMGSRVRISDSGIRDGLSNTVCLGESLEAIDNGTRIGGPSWCFGGIARGRGNLPWGDTGGNGRYLFGDSLDSSLSGFGSAHSNCINLGFADGRTDVVTRSVNLRVWYSICGIEDGLR